MPEVVSTVAEKPTNRMNCLLNIPIYHQIPLMSLIILYLGRRKFKVTTFLMCKVQLIHYLLFRVLERHCNL